MNTPPVIPRPYQRACADSFYGYYQAGNSGHGLIVVPTAGGKSLIIGILATEICQTFPGQRILILSHVQELIKQNFEKVRLCCPRVSAGIYASALKLYQADRDVVVAMIQSVYKKADIIGHIDLIFIDEAHLMQFGAMGMYGEFIKAMLEINPYLKICGFTATDYRLDGGRLTEGEGKIFDDVIIEIPIQHLLDEGYLTPPISKASLAQADMEGVKITAGEYNIKQMAARFDQREFINAALDSDMEYLKDRRSIALFCATLENANHVAEGMSARGMHCEVIDGQMSPEDREDKLERFRSGELRGLASVGVLTTGTDVPNIDAVVLFRAMLSPGLYQQIIGRGFRVVYAPGYDIATKEGRLDAIRNGGKSNFLVLDHGGNIERHGPVTNVEKPQKREKGEKVKRERSKARICEICRTAWPLDVCKCGICGHEMYVPRDATSSLSIEASNSDIMGSPFMRGEMAAWFDVDDVHYARHKKEGRPHTLKVTYFCGILQFNEWLHFERIGRLRQHALKWWSDRTNSPTFIPDDVAQALGLAATLRKPHQIQVIKKDKFYEVLKYEFHPAGQKPANIGIEAGAAGG